MTNCTVEQREARHWIGVSMTGELAQWDRVNAQVPRIYGALAAAGIAPLGGPIYQYRRMLTADEPMDLVVSVPVAPGAAIGEGFDSGVLPGGRYVVGRPSGGPDALASTHGDMWRWAELNGLELAIEERSDGIHWAARTEQFLTDPDAEPDRSKWLVEVAYLLR